MDDDYFTFVSLAEFQSVETILNYGDKDKFLYPNCSLISDYLVWCWGYAVQLDQMGVDGVVYQVEGVSKRKVADTFTAFLQ